jgi:hypothetical protein
MNKCCSLQSRPDHIRLLSGLGHHKSCNTRKQMSLQVLSILVCWSLYMMHDTMCRIHHRPVPFHPIYMPWNKYRMDTEVVLGLDWFQFQQLLVVIFYIGWYYSFHWTSLDNGEFCWQCTSTICLLVWGIGLREEVIHVYITCVGAWVLYLTTRVVKIICRICTVLLIHMMDVYILKTGSISVYQYYLPL